MVNSIFVPILDQMTSFLSIPLMELCIVRPHTFIVFYLQDNVPTPILERGMSSHGISLLICFEGASSSLYSLFLISFPSLPGF